MTTAPVQPTSAPLSTLMREGSRAEHEDAENSRFMSSLLAGQVSEAGYTHYLGLYRRVYDALESVARAFGDDPIAAAVVDPGLERLEAIDADLEHWTPRHTDMADISSPATDAYVAQIRATSEWAGLFVAHHYTRYLGDLSGGQAIGRILKREFDLADRGTDFYRFDAIPKPKPYKDAYRARLDALPLSDAQRERILDEVKQAFRLNQGIFEELDGYLPRYAR